MPDGRMLRKKISRDCRVAQLTPHSALLYVLSIPHLDLDGKMDGAPVAVRGTVVQAFASTQPADWTDEKVAAYMAEWGGTRDENTGAVRALVAHYCVAGVWACYFPGFHDNQKLNRQRERPSSFPDPPEWLLCQLGITDADSVPDADSGSTPDLLRTQAEAEVQEQDLRADQRGMSRAREADRAALPDHGISHTHDLGTEIAQAVENRKAALTTHGPLARLLEVLPDADEQTPAVLHSVFDGLPEFAIEHARREVLAAAPRRPSAYALRIGQRLAGSG